MPGSVSDSSQGPSDDSPYVPSWLYKNGPKECPCGDTENYHNDDGECLRKKNCGCAGLPSQVLTPFSEME